MIALTSESTFNIRGQCCHCVKIRNKSVPDLVEGQEVIFNGESDTIVRVQKGHVWSGTFRIFTVMMQSDVTN